VKIIPAAYGLNVTDPAEIADLVKEWLAGDNYIFPPSKKVRTILLLVVFTGYLWE
jgi:hypothetical protein